ncbi:uncharacterized protein LOC105279020 isoform X2 [Ooceraea biroi]|uniref:uncharacterized protein LOC105279020 isoform X2 n=1 Tax=Ooceraea biroi TaxID=2015173 RepID=UPI000F098CC6|nr:uncharacterized protein LOC105279020 isoform X2 [Ooceraea biroi]
MKSAVLVVALVAARRASAGSRGGYGYSDVTLHVLEWITYLKRLSLIALMLCAVVLYYVPKSRSHARRVCCALIDFIADGLKSVLSITEIKYEHIMAGDQDDKNKEPRIQKQCGKLFKENANGRGQKCADKINIHGHRSMSTSKESRRKQQWRKSRTKRSIDGEHERHRLHSHHHRNAAIKDVSSESGATITPTAERWRQMEATKKCGRDNVVVTQDISLNTKYDMTNSLKDDIDLRPEGFIEADYPLKTIEIESPSLKKADLEITNEGSVNSIAMRKNSEHSDCSFINKCSTRSPMTQVSDNSEKIDFIYPPNKKFQIVSRTLEKQEMSASNFDKTDKDLRRRQNVSDTEHEKVTSTVQRQSRRNCTSSILSKQLADPYYGEALTTRDSYERLQRENHRFLLSMKKIVDDCSYENAPIIKNRAKPVLLRVFNWLFSGCPEASRRRREQVEVVGKEGTVECTNAWLR